MTIKGFAINGRYWVKTQTGVERYAREINSRLPEGRLIIPARSHSHYTGHLWEQLYLPKLLRPHECLWSPANSGPVLIARQVLTIQDISPVDHPEWFSFAFSNCYRLLWRILIPRVRLITVPSQFTRRRILARFRVSPERVVVVSGGVDSSFRPVSKAVSSRLLAQYGIPGAYLLFVGTRQPRKNLSRLLAAWAQLQDIHPDLALVIVGGTSSVFSRQEVRESYERVHLLGYVPDQDLPALYSRSLALVYPSLYEGFGLPVLEAMACGAPVIASDIEPLRELIGEAGRLVDPGNVVSLASAICEVCEDPSLRYSLRAKGLARVREFTWDHAAQKMWQMLGTVH